MFRDSESEKCFGGAMNMILGDCPCAAARFRQKRRNTKMKRGAQMHKTLCSNMLAT